MKSTDKDSVENINKDIMRERKARQQDTEDSIQACIYNIKRRNLDNKIKKGLDDKPLENKTIEEEKQRKKAEFWHRTWIVCKLIFVAIIAYTLFHFV